MNTYAFNIHVHVFVWGISFEFIWINSKEWKFGVLCEDIFNFIRNWQTGKVSVTFCTTTTNEQVNVLVVLYPHIHLFLISSHCNRQCCIILIFNPLITYDTEYLFYVSCHLYIFLIICLFQFFFKIRLFTFSLLRFKNSLNILDNSITHVSVQVLFSLCIVYLLILMSVPFSEKKCWF
jgi:hypothetical protein